MNLLLSLDRFSDASGGADSFARDLADALLKRGVTITVLERSKTKSEVRTRSDGLTLKTLKLERFPLIRDTHLNFLWCQQTWQRLVQEELSQATYDYLYTQGFLTPASILAGKEQKIPTLAYIHGFEGLNPEFFLKDPSSTSRPYSFLEASLLYQLKWPIVKKTLHLYKEAYQGATHLLTNSVFTAEVAELNLHRRALVFYPLLGTENEFDKPRKPSKEGPILFVKPHPMKGLKVVLELAKRLPRRTFLFVGKLDAKLNTRLPSNVTHIPWCDHMATIYLKASLLIGPAQFPEPFGRVFVEAQRFGIPCLGSNLGGIPEAIGQAGLLIPYDAPTEAWVQGIEEIFQGYETFSNHALEHFKEVIAKSTPRQFLRILHGS